MVSGADREAFTSCEDLEARSGYRPSRVLRLVLNPAYDPVTDSSEVRERPFERMILRFFSDEDTIAARIVDGRIDLSMGDVPHEIERRFEGDPERREYLKTNPGDIT